MRHTRLDKALVHEHQLGFIGNLKDDSVSVGRKIARARFACGVHELGSNGAEI